MSFPAGTSGVTASFKLRTVTFVLSLPGCVSVSAEQVRVGHNQSFSV